MRDGVDRAGRNLYPAFPFDHFTRVTDEDVGAIYAYIMTRDAVPSRVPANRLKFPMNIRPLLSGWKALYFDRGVYRPDPARSAEWNRGAYLVEGLRSLRRLPYAARHPGRRNQERSVRRRRSRRVARECDQCVVAGADAMDGRPVDPVPSPGSRRATAPPPARCRRSFMGCRRRPRQTFARDGDLPDDGHGRRPGRGRAGVLL